MLRGIIHALLAAVGVVLWLVLAAGSAALIGLALLGDRVWPHADRGNCWSWALPRWARGGGALLISMRRVGWLPIPHAAWWRPDGLIEQTEPMRRARTVTEAIGLRVIYFRYRVVSDQQRDGSG